MNGEKNPRAKKHIFAEAEEAEAEEEAGGGVVVLRRPEAVEPLSCLVQRADSRPSNPRPLPRMIFLPYLVLKRRSSQIAKGLDPLLNSAKTPI